MGGEREIETNMSNREAGTNMGDIRIHEKNGEVHFHSKKLKVAVPVGIWFQAWMRLMDLGGTFKFFDIERNTAIDIKVDNICGELDVVASINEVKIGETFKLLHKFTTRK
jgi:hypothetical protein